MDASLSPANADPRPFLVEFSRRPGLWIGHSDFDRVEMFLRGMLMGRGEWLEVAAWWEGQHGRSELAWTARICERVTGKRSARAVTEAEAPDVIGQVCKELARFYRERFDPAG